MACPAGVSPICVPDICSTDRAASWGTASLLHVLSVPASVGAHVLGESRQCSSLEQAHAGMKLCFHSIDLKTTSAGSQRFPPSQGFDCKVLSTAFQTCILNCSTTVQAYLKKAGPQIVAGNQLPGLLGVFQKLIASKALDHEGYKLLDSVMEHVRFKGLQQYLPTVCYSFPCSCADDVKGCCLLHHLLCRSAAHLPPVEHGLT